MSEEEEFMDDHEQGFDEEEIEEEKEKTDKYGYTEQDWEDED